ncbi:penicillin amidase [Flavobacteriaceae bacterium MAR_2010_188]|nr:penicillin amidase [Flavobacteriaceae bacterium MAR_2010_188]
MKYLKLLLSLLLTVAIFWALNTKLGSIPPLGKFLSPSTGFWQNEVSNISTEDVSFEGIEEQVTIHYDKFHIPHIFANNSKDLAFAQGYITAKDRMWQMEFQTHAAAGRISEIIGDAALDFDRTQRRKGMTFGAENSLVEMMKDEETAVLIRAYVAGVNNFLEDLTPDNYPIEYKLLDYQPELYTELKVGLLLMYMTDMLAGGDDDLENTNFITRYGKERFDFLYPDFFEINDPIIPADKDWSNLEVEKPKNPNPEIPNESINEVMEKPDPDNGSNNWAVAPKKSYSGNAILANDPHLGLKLPSIWYVMQLSTPDQKAFGATLPGVLGVISGFNEHIAWGETNATRDVRDWYKIEFKDETKSEYRLDGEWRPTTKRIEEIKVRNQPTYNDTVVYTHHGPVSYDDSYKGNSQKIGYAMKWIGHAGGNNQKTFLELNKGKNYDDYVNALKNYVAPAQNFVFASTEGDIALWIQGKFPNKWKGQGKFLMDGTKSVNDWQSFIPQENNAFIKNPERGFVSSANQVPVDKSYPYYVFNDGYETYRNRVINDFFRSKEKFDIQDFKDLHNSNYNLRAAELLPLLIGLTDTIQLDNNQRGKLNIVSKWNYYNNIDLEGPTIFEEWLTNFEKLLWDEYDDAEFSMSKPFSYRTTELVKNNPDDEFMDILATPQKETAKDLALLSFKDAVKSLDDYSKDEDNLNWGKYKSTYVGHLLQSLPAFSRFDLPIGGNRGIVNATSQTHGPSWRMIVEMSTPPKAIAIYPGGQSGNPGSKYYDDFVDIWASGEYIELLFMQDLEEMTGIIATQNLKPKQ